MEALDLAHRRKMREEEFRMLSRNMSDKLLKIKALDAVKDIYDSMSVGNRKIVQIGGKGDIVAGMINRLASIVEEQPTALPLKAP